MVLAPSAPARVGCAPGGDGRTPAGDVRGLFRTRRYRRVPRPAPPAGFAKCKVMTPDSSVWRTNWPRPGPGSATVSSIAGPPDLVNQVGLGGSITLLAFMIWTIDWA